MPRKKKGDELAAGGSNGQAHEAQAPTARPEAATPEAEPQQAPVNGSGGSRSKPAHELRIGRIKVTAWRNVSAEHGEWFSFTFGRSYKQGDTWKTAHSMGADDLLVLALIAADMKRWHASETKKPRPSPTTAERQPGEDDVTTGGNNGTGTGGNGDIPF